MSRKMVRGIYILPEMLPAGISRSISFIQFSLTPNELIHSLHVNVGWQTRDISVLRFFRPCRSVIRYSTGTQLHDHSNGYVRSYRTAVFWFSVMKLCLECVLSLWVADSRSSGFDSLMLENKKIWLQLSTYRTCRLPSTNISLRPVHSLPPWCPPHLPCSPDIQQ